MLYHIEQKRTCHETRVFISSCVSCMIDCTWREKYSQQVNSDMIAGLRLTSARGHCRQICTIITQCGRMDLPSFSQLSRIITALCMKWTTNKHTELAFSSVHVFRRLNHLTDFDERHQIFYGWQAGTGTGLLRRTRVLPCQYPSVDASHIFIHLPSKLNKLNTQERR